MAHLTRKVLIIDDDEIYQFLIKKQIERCSKFVTVMGFFEGGSAMEFLKENAQDSQKLPDVILLDIEMPVMDGWDFLEGFITLHPKLSKDVQLYMVSSSISDIDKNRASKYPLIKEYLVKPVPKEKIASIVC